MKMNALCSILVALLLAACSKQPEPTLAEKVATIAECMRTSTCQQQVMSEVRIGVPMKVIKIKEHDTNVQFILTEDIPSLAVQVRNPGVQIRIIDNDHNGEIDGFTGEDSTGAQGTYLRGDEGFEKFLPWATGIYSDAIDGAWKLVVMQK